MAAEWESHHGKELEDVIRLEERALTEVQWSDLSMPLNEFVEEYTMPQMVQIVDGFYSEVDESSLSSGQIMKVHCLKKISDVWGVGQNGDNIYVALNTPQQIRLRPANFDHIYESVYDLTRAKPFPKFVEVVRGYYDPTGSGAKTGKDLTIEAGEILEVIRTSENPLFNLMSKEKHTVFKNMKGVEISLPHDCQPGFRVLLGRDACFLAEAVNQNSFPFYGSFVESKLQSDRTSDKKLSKLGVVRFEGVHKRDLIIASCGLWSVRVVFTIPKDIDVTVRVAKGTLTRDPGYVGLCQGYNNYKKIDELVVKRYELDIHRNAQEVNGYEYHIRTASEGEFMGLPSQDDQRDDSLDKDDSAYDDALNQGDVTEGSAECHNERTNSSVSERKDDILVDQGSPVTTRPRQGSYNLPVGSRAYQQDREPVRLVGMKALASSTERLEPAYGHETNHSTTMSKDTAQEQIILQHGYLNGQQQNGTPTPEIKSSITHRDMVSDFSKEPLQNQPQNTKPNVEDRKGSPFQPDVASVSSDFKIPTDLSSLDTKGVCLCLKILNLRHLVETFEENQINGSLLVSLDDEDLNDLIAKRFERKKLMRFIEGWRPDK